MRSAAGVYYEKGRHSFFIPGGKAINGRFDMWGYEDPSIAVSNGLGEILKSLTASRRLSPLTATRFLSA